MPENLYVRKRAIDALYAFALPEQRGTRCCFAFLHTYRLHAVCFFARYLLSFPCEAGRGSRKRGGCTLRRPAAKKSPGEKRSGENTGSRKQNGVENSDPFSACRAANRQRKSLAGRETIAYDRDGKVTTRTVKAGKARTMRLTANAVNGRADRQGVQGWHRRKRQRDRKNRSTGWQRGARVLGIVGIVYHSRPEKYKKNREKSNASRDCAGTAFSLFADRRRAIGAYERFKRKMGNKAQGSACRESDLSRFASSYRKESRTGNLPHCMFSIARPLVAANKIFHSFRTCEQGRRNAVGISASERFLIFFDRIVFAHVAGRLAAHRET